MGLNGHDIRNFEAIPLLSQSSLIRKKRYPFTAELTDFSSIFFYLKRDSDRRPSTP